LKKKQNLHIHTNYSDGKDSPEEIVTEAIRRGFDSIGFSEHTYMPFSSYPHQLTPNDMDKYSSEIRALKLKYRGKLDIFCGLEFEMFSDVPTAGFDYMIGSVHYLDLEGQILGFDHGLAETLEYVNTNFGGDGISFAKKYFETVSSLPEKRNFDILGHFDLVTKNNDVGKFIDTTSKEYLDLGFAAIHALRGKIPFFELNTGAISRGYRTSPYPQIDFLKEFNSLGFGVVITSDCHDKNYLDCHFDEAVELLSAAGFRSKFVLTDHGFEEDAL
jgi:histidinol-phosphatase (PHP family)